MTKPLEGRPPSFPRTGPLRVSRYTRAHLALPLGTFRVFFRARRLAVVAAFFGRKAERWLVICRRGAGRMLR